MKILVLNPKINAKHEISKNLLKKGVAFLFSETADEAVKLLESHGDTIDLAIIHRETTQPKNFPGIIFLEKLKKNDKLSELPVVLTTDIWNDSECAEHQDGPNGANAYLHSPFTEAQLVKICEEVLGRPLAKGVAAAPPKKNSASSPGSLPVLEDASVLFKSADMSNSDRISGISLNLEDFGVEGLSFGNQSAEQPSAQSETPAEVSIDTAVDSAGSSDSSQDFVLTRNNDVPAGGGNTSQSQSQGSLEISALPEDSGELLDVSGAPRSQASVSAPGRADLNNKTKDLPSASGGESQSVGIKLAPLSEIDLGHSSFGRSELQVDEELASGSFENIPGEIGSNSISQGMGGDSTSVESSSSEDMELPLSLSGQSTPADATEDSGAPEEMPYLKPGYSKPSRAVYDPAMIFAEPLGDAVIPGGAANAPDLETFKKYLMLREQDVAVLSNQLQAAYEQLEASEKILKEERVKFLELSFQSSEQQKKIDEFEKEKTAALDRMRAEIEELAFQLKAKTDKSRVLERQIRETIEEMEQLKTRVRTDIRKIRVREKELENRLEMNKKDSEALIAARETKIIELKRKLDLIEFNMDLLQDQYTREKGNSAKLRERLVKAAQVVRVAGGLLDSNKEGRDGQAADSETESINEEGLEDGASKAS